MPNKIRNLPREAEPELGWKILDSLDVTVVVLDKSGSIVYANKAWNDFAAKNPLPDGSPVRNIEIGVNYLEICRQANGNSDENARAAHRGIRDVLTSKRRFFSLDYPCHSPSQHRWFTLSARLLRRDGQVRVVVAHTDITRFKLAEIESQRQIGNVAAAFNRLRSITEKVGTSLLIDNPALIAAMDHDRRIPRGETIRPDVPRTRLELLSNREKEVMLAIVRGERNTEIASRLQLSPKSVSTYRSRVLEKLGVRNNAELAASLARLGLT